MSVRRREAVFDHDSRLTAESWSVLWDRCAARIHSWRVPPCWSVADWREESQAEGALAVCDALCEFDPARGVPEVAFLYERVVAAVWRRYRQEWRLARLLRGTAALRRQAPSESMSRDPELLDRLEQHVDSLSEPDRQLVVQLFWDGRTEAELAEELGLSRQGFNWRKQQVIEKLSRGLIRES